MGSHIFGMGSIAGHRIDYNGRGSERPAAHTQQNLTQVPLGDVYLYSSFHLPRNRQDNCTCSYHLCLYIGRSSGTHCQ